MADLNPIPGRLTPIVRAARWFGWFWTVAQWHEDEPRRIPVGWRPTREWAERRARRAVASMWRADARARAIEEGWQEVSWHEWKVRL